MGASRPGRRLSPTHLGPGNLCFLLESWTCRAPGPRERACPVLCPPACRRRGRGQGSGRTSGSSRCRARTGALGPGASPLACALPELGHPRIQLLLVSHLKDDVCPVLHLVGGRERPGGIPGAWTCSPTGAKLGHSPSAQRCRGCPASRGVCTAGPPGCWSRLLAAWALNSRKPSGALEACPCWPFATQACFSVSPGA